MSRHVEVAPCVQAVPFHLKTSPAPGSSPTAQKSMAVSPHTPCSGFVTPVVVATHEAPVQRSATPPLPATKTLFAAEPQRSKNVTAPPAPWAEGAHVKPSQRRIVPPAPATQPSAEPAPHPA